MSLMYHLDGQGAEKVRCTQDGGVENVVELLPHYYTNILSLYIY